MTVSPRRLRSGDAGHHVVRVDFTVRRLEREGGGELERDRGEVRVGGRPPRHFEVQARGAEERHRPFPRDPPLDLQPVEVPAGSAQGELLARPGSAHHFPGIPRGTGLVHDQRPERPHRGRFLELVGPAAVVGHRVAAEVVLSRRVVHQHDQDLAGEVGVPEVVPPVFRRLDAVADEEQLSGGVDLRHHPLRPGHEVHPRLPVAAGIGRGPHGDRRGTHERHRLDPGAVRVAGFEPQFLERARQVGDGLLLAGRGGRPSAELVRGQRGDVREEAVLVEASAELAAAGERQGRDQDGRGSRRGQEAKHRGFSLGREQSLPESRLC